MASHDALRRSLKFKLKLILSENKILMQTIEEHIKKAESIYRDTESLEKIDTKVFKRAMSRLETAYSACIKLILLASDLFESDKRSLQDVSGSSCHKMDQSDSVRTLDKETMRRLSSLERKFQSYVSMRGQEGQGSASPQTGGMREWPGVDGQVFDRMCSIDGPDVFCPADPVTELRRFLYGLDCRSYDGYRDPRIILSNERKKYPNELMVGPTRAGQDQGHPPYSGDIDGAVGFGDVGTTPHGANIGPLRGFGVEARGVQEGGGQDAWGHGGLGYPSNGQVDIGQVCHLQKDCLVSGNVMVAERESLSQSEYGDLKPAQNGEMLYSPERPLRPDWTDSRGSRRQHADQDPGRNVVNAAAEKLRHGLGQAASYPLRWIKRAQSSPSPPSPPPPSVEGYRSPVTGIPKGYQKEVIQTWNGGTPGTMCPDRPSHVTPNRNMVCGYSSYISGEIGSLPRVPAEENTILNAPRTIYGAAGHVIFPTKSGLPYPQHGDRPAGTEQQQETMRPEYPLYGRFNNTATSQTSPEKPKNHMEDPEISNSVVMNSGHPQSGLTIMKPNSPNLPQRSKPRPANHLAYSAPVPTSRPTLTQPKSPRGEDTVHCILERISNMERLLEQEISAERALLTKCLLEFQKLLGGGNMETRDGNGLFGKQNERVEDTREEKQPQHKRLELSSKHRDVARSGKNGSPPDKIKGQEISPRSKTCAQKSSEKKYFKHHAKRHGELKDKHLRNSTGKLNASRKHQSSPVNSSGSAEGANIDNDSNYDNHEHAPYNEITTSCSLTGTWEDTTSTCHVENGTENTHHGLLSYLRSNEKWQTYETSVKDVEQVQRITKCSSTENERPKSPRSPRSLPDPEHRSKKGQYCELAEKKLKRSFHQAQKAMLHMMVERVNAHLLAMSALERMDSSSGNSSSHHQQELQTRDCEPDLALVPVLNPTVKPFKVSNKSSDGPRDACELNQGKAKSQLQSTTTQTCDMENLVDHSTLLPCLSGREPNEKSPKDSVQHRKVATLDLAPELVSSPAQTSNHASDQPMQHGQLEFTQPQIAEPMEQRQLQQTFQQLSEQASNLMDIPLAKDFSPQRKPIPPVEIHPSRLLETGSGEAQAAKIQQIIHEGQHPGQYGFSSTILQQDPTFLQLPRVSWRNRDGIICPLDFLRTHQLTSHHPDFLYPCPTEPRTAQDGLPRVCPEQPGSLPYTNFLCGEGDILPPSGHLQFDPQCPIHGVMEPALHRGHTAQVVCSQQKQDNFIQQFQLPVHPQQRQSTPPQEHPWQEQQQQHHHEPLEPQVQYQHHLQQHVDGDHQMEQMHMICQPETQSHHHQRHHIQQQYSNHLLPQTEGHLHHRHDPYKTNSNHKINLPNSCPTVAFISAGDHPEQVFSHKQAHRSVLACPSFPSTPPAGWADNPGPVSWIPQPSAGQTPCTNSKTKSRSQVSPRKVGTGVKDSTVYEDSVAAIEKNPQSKKTESTGGFAKAKRAVSQGSCGRSKAEQRTVCMTNLPPQLEEMDLLKVLNRHGFVSKIYLIKHRKTGQFQGTAYAKFRECPEAESAVTALNNLVLAGQPISASLMEKRSPKAAS